MQRETDHESPLTPELQARLLEALASGLKPRYVALLCSVSPRVLYSWLDQGGRKDAMQPYLRFTVMWTRTESELMRKHVENWSLAQVGAGESRAFLAARWPKVWGKDADPDFEVLQASTSNAEEQSQMEEILADPAAFGLFELFAKYDRLTADERMSLSVAPQPTTE